MGDQSENVKCPSCNGSKKLVPVFVSYAEGHSGPPVIEIECDTCNGTGEITQEHVARRELGKKFRRYRIDVLELGLREASDQWGMTCSDLCKIEQGKKVTDWVPPGWKGQE